MCVPTKIFFHTCLCFLVHSLFTPQYFYVFFKLFRCSDVTYLYSYDLCKLQIYPTSIRTTGVGIASSIGRIGGMVCPLVAVALVKGCHQTAAIVLFEIVILLSGICVVFFPFETKGQDLPEKV